MKEKKNGMSDKKKGMIMLIVDTILITVFGFVFGWFAADGDVKIIFITGGSIIGFLTIYYIVTAKLRHKYIFKSGLFDPQVGEKL